MRYIIDIDGTLLKGSEPINGAIDFIKSLNTKNITYLLMTNSIKSKDVQIERLSKAGFKFSNVLIINPIIAINEYLKEKHIQNVKIIGSNNEIEQIYANNVEIGYEIVILLDFEKANIGFSILQDIIKDIENNIEVITASRSSFYLKQGKKIIDTGAFVKLLEEITSIEIRNFGKPSMDYFKIAKSLLHSHKDEIYVLGDDWNTDIMGANKFGFKSILVRSGKYQDKDEIKCNPTKVVDNLTDI